MHVTSSNAGADYVFRVNDDTEIETVGWAGLMAARLASLRPSNLGVVGPSGRHDASQSRKMITHDFVHKTHLRIFPTYYPAVLSDWWMDDWISNVYASSNALKLREVVVVHHTEVVANVYKTDPGDPVRYEVDFSHKPFLLYETRKGRQAIATFIQTECAADDCTPRSQEAIKRGGARSRGADESIDALTNSYSRGTAEDDELVSHDAVSPEEALLFGKTEADSFETHSFANGRPSPSRATTTRADGQGRHTRGNGGVGDRRTTGSDTSDTSDSDRRSTTTPKPLSVEESDAQALAYMKEVLGVRSFHAEVLFLSISLSRRRSQ